jgi:hypothetical protein
MGRERDDEKVTTNKYDGFRIKKSFDRLLFLKTFFSAVCYNQPACLSSFGDRSA